MSVRSALDVCELTGLMQSCCSHCFGTLPDDADPMRTSLLNSLSDWVCADRPGRCVVCGMPYPQRAAIVPEGGGRRADCCPRRLR
jgi:hypothetical protein